MEGSRPSARHFAKFPGGPYIMRHRFSYLFSVLLASLLLFSTRCSAQAPIEPAQLPGRTLFYLLWRGAPAGDIRKTNSMLSLWDDPDFAPYRSAFVEALINDSKKQKTKPAMSREELTELSPLLDNSFIVGYLAAAETPAAPKTDTAKSATPFSTPAPTPPAWNGAFFIYNRAGKEDLLAKAVLRMRTSDTEIPKLTNLTVAGVPALKIERKSGTTYWTETGKFAVSAQDPAVFEEILNRLNGKSTATPLSQSASYQEAVPLLSGGIVEFFLRVPDLKTIDTGSDPMAVQGRALVSKLKIESLHSIAGHVSLESSKTRLQGAILGDASAGTLFDIWPDGQTSPASMAFLSADTVYFNESQINLPGIYKLIKNAFTSAGSNSTPMADALESAAKTRLGMPLSDALALTTGEIGSLQNSPSLDPAQKVYLLGIRNKPDSLKLVRTILGDQVTSERAEGTTTFLKISLHGSQGSSGLAQWNFYHLAMTPDFLIGSSKNETLRALLAQQSDGASPNVPPNLLKARSQFPDTLNGFTFLDFQKLDWPALKVRWIADANKSVKEAKSIDAANSSKKLADWMEQVDPKVIPKHLHTVTGASWKDAHGVHFDEWLE
jgi:hypothetical protein